MTFPDVFGGIVVNIFISPVPTWHVQNVPRAESKLRAKVLEKRVTFVRNTLRSRIARRVQTSIVMCKRIKCTQIAVERIVYRSGINKTGLRT